MQFIRLVRATSIGLLQQIPLIGPVIKAIFDEKNRPDLGSGQKLAEQVRNEIIVFLATFEHALDAVGPIPDQIKLVPRGLVPLKNIYAEQYVDKFMKIAKIHESTQIQAPNGKLLPVNAALLFLLQSAWDKGYFMAKFYRQKRITLPKEVASSDKVLGWIIKEYKGVENMGAHIDVFLQRAVSISTEKEPIERSILMFPFGKALLKIIKPNFTVWSDCVRSLFGSGIMASEAEDALFKQ